MGPLFIVVSAQPVTRDDLHTFIVEQGGSLATVGHMVLNYDGILYRTDARVDLGWDRDCDADWTAPIEPVNSSPKAVGEWRHQLEVRKALRTKLGAEPRACIIVELVHGEPTQRLAWQVIQDLFKRWPPCVLRRYISYLSPEFDQEIWTLDELRAFWAEHGHLPDL